MTASTLPIVRRPRSWGLRVQRGRHVLQLGFVALVAYVAAQRLIFPEDSGVLTPSGEALCPFGGFESFYKWVTSGGTFIPHTHAANLVLAASIVLVAVAARGFFCGWICPFGALQEGIAALSHGLQRRFPLLRRGIRALERRLAPVAFLDHWLRYLKYAVMVWAIGGAALFGVMVFRDVDPWSALVNVTELEAVGGLVVLGVAVAASFFVERPWCRYACPLGAVQGILGRIGPLAIERASNACLSCNVCSANCPVNIPVHAVTRVTSPDCIGCLQCVGACPSEGGLGLKLALPGARPTIARPVLLGALLPK